MGLVDYSDSDSAPESDSSAAEPNPKRRKSTAASVPSPSPTTTTTTTTTTPCPPKPSLPPLPANFHDLYASTVRQSTVDDPSLHQGRKRLNPHVAGNWPSHVYIEWHPSPQEHETLVALIQHIQTRLPATTTLTSLLTSDLGAPLPLHISLSRPLPLTTANKDGFLDSITTAVHAASIGPFYVEPYTLKFFRSPDSDRTFLVLGVRPPSPAPKDSAPPRVSPQAASPPSTVSHAPRNPLTTLLRKCNAAAQSLHLPLLYQKTGGSGPDENAFHISLAWTLDHVPDADRVLGRDDRHPETPLDRIKEWTLEISGVKVKIGNVVTHVGLDKTGGMSKKALFDW